MISECPKAHYFGLLARVWTTYNEQAHPNECTGTDVLHATPHREVRYMVQLPPNFSSNNCTKREQVTTVLHKV